MRKNDYLRPQKKDGFVRNTEKVAARSTSQKHSAPEVMKEIERKVSSGKAEPEAYSKEVYALAEYWVEVGTKVLTSIHGKGGQDVKPAASVNKFATKLSKAINHDRELVGKRRKYKGESECHTVYKGILQTRGKEHLHDVLVRMIDDFWEYVASSKDPEETNRLASQRLFFAELWEYVRYRSIQAVETRRILKMKNLKETNVLDHIAEIGVKTAALREEEEAARKSLPVFPEEDHEAVHRADILQNAARLANLVSNLERLKTLAREKKERLHDRDLSTP